MDCVIICTPSGSYRMTEELIDDYIYPVNLRQEIERLKRKSKAQGFRERKNSAKG